MSRMDHVYVTFMMLFFVIFEAQKPLIALSLYYNDI